MAQTPEQRRASAKRTRLMRLFRITPEEQDDIEKYQRDGDYNILLGKVMGTDHCHVSGMIRGRLDFRINRALGLIENSFRKDPLRSDTSRLLHALARYIEHPPAVDVIGKRYGLLGKAQVKRKMVYGGSKKKARKK